MFCKARQYKMEHKGGQVFSSKERREEEALEEGLNPKIVVHRKLERVYKSASFYLRQ